MFCCMLFTSYLFTVDSLRQGAANSLVMVRSARRGRQRFHFKALDTKRSRLSACFTRAMLRAFPTERRRFRKALPSGVTQPPRRRMRSA